MCKGNIEEDKDVMFRSKALEERSTFLYMEIGMDISYISIPYLLHKW